MYDEFTAKMIRKCEALEQENAQLKAMITPVKKDAMNDPIDIEKLLENMELHGDGWNSTAKLGIKQLLKENEQLKAELVQCQQRAARLRECLQKAKWIVREHVRGPLADEIEHALEEDQA